MDHQTCDCVICLDVDTWCDRFLEDPRQAADYAKHEAAAQRMLTHLGQRTNLPAPRDPVLLEDLEVQ